MRSSNTGRTARKSSKPLGWVKVSFLGLALTALIGLALGAAASGHLGRSIGPFHHCGVHGLIADVVDDLNLNSEQQARLDTIHQLIESHLTALHQAQAEHHDQWLARVEQGEMNQDEVRQAVDAHIEEARTLAYQVSEELVPLLNSLSDEQRTTLVRRLGEIHDAMATLHGATLHGATLHGATLDSAAPEGGLESGPTS